MLVRKEGFEPPRPFGHKILSLARLPVPPLPQVVLLFYRLPNWPSIGILCGTAPQIVGAQAKSPDAREVAIVLDSRKWQRHNTVSQKQTLGTSPARPVRRVFRRLREKTLRSGAAP